MVAIDQWYMEKHRRSRCGVVSRSGCCGPAPGTAESVWCGLAISASHGYTLRVMPSDSKKLHPFAGIILLMGGFGVMGGGLLAPALPALTEPFGVGEDAVGLVLGIYTFAAALGLPFIGFCIDLWGRKATGITCLLIDGMFGLLCPLAPNFTVLLIFRFFQGLGIAGLIPVAMTVISDWYGGEMRLRAMGLLSGTISLSAVVVPLTGGLLAGLDWRYPFLVYGFSLLLAFFFLVLIPESGSVGQWSGLGAAAKKHFRGLAAALKTLEVRSVFCQCLMLYFLLYALVTFLPIYLAGTYGVYALGAGLALSVQAVTGAIVSSRSVAVNRLLPGRWHVLAGFLLLAVAMASVPLWPGRSCLA